MNSDLAAQGNNVDAEGNNVEELFVYNYDSDEQAEAEGAEDNVEGITVNHDIPPPPVDLLYHTLEEALQSIREFTKGHGYALTTLRSKKDKDGEIKKVVLQCNRGKFRPSQVREQDRQRIKGTRRLNCPFSAKLVHSKTIGAWVFEVCNSAHNHLPSSASTHPSLRRDELNTHFDSIQRQLSIGTPASHILTSLRQNGAEISLRPRDIHNLRWNMRREFLDGRTPIQALLTQIPEGGDWICNWETEDNNVVTAVFCTHKSALELLRRYHYVLFMDCTYKTNRYGMPMMDIVGVTPINKTFFVGFGFVKDEKEPSLTFLLRNLRDIYRNLNLPDPRTFLIDKDEALMNSIKAVFPSTDFMLCLWHVNKNILAKSRSFFRRDVLATRGVNDPAFLDLVKEMETAFMGRWWAVIGAPTVPEMIQTWADFRKEYSSYNELLSYINDEWMNEDTMKRILHIHTNSYLHLGNQATSRVEGAHWCLKRDLHVSTNDLLGVVQSFERTVTNQHINLQQQIDDERIKKQPHHLDFLFRNLLGKIANHAIRLVVKIRDYYLPVGPGKAVIKDCTGTTRKTLGIPCIHEIQTYVNAKNTLGMAQFHPHWYITTLESLPPIDPRLLVLEPQRNRTRGRPKGAKNKPTSQEEASTQATATDTQSIQDSSTHREASRFEVILQEGRGRRCGRGRGRSHGGGRGSSSTQETIIPASQPMNEQMTQPVSQLAANQTVDERGGRGGRGGRGRGGRSGRGGRGGNMGGIPDAMLNMFQL